ncbi:ribosomal L1 domain-containing protein CG13096 [Manduca sexta]|uniref:ribosomal L1 domain-containing protein CG13096 n=1 Tax=Manduca sexta TaxID=7130 RepID=UPI001181E581|nr:ribosomal L1 domain-containing protein CG13096 [Manduca sexta]
MVAIKQKAAKNIKPTNKVQKIKKKQKPVKKLVSPIKTNNEKEVSIISKKKKNPPKSKGNKAPIISKENKGPISSEKKKLPATSKQNKAPVITKKRKLPTISKEEVVSGINEAKEVKKRAKYIMPTKSVTDDVVNSCLNALQQLAIQHKKKNTILNDDTPIFAEIHCMKIQSTKGNIKFVLPHSTFASTGEICLITPDLKKGRKIDHEPTVDHWEELLRKEGVTSVKTVLPLRQLKVEYDQFELKRRLLTQHDFIMVDTRVLNHASHILGKMFFKKHNMLIPVRLENKKLKDAIDVGLRTSVLRLNEGETSTIIVGHTSMPQEKVKENVLSLIDQIRTKYPGGEPNIRSICLKLPLSLSLPLYMTLRPSNTVNPPKMRKRKPNNFKVLEDDLSTQPGHKVKVGPDGTVHLVKSKDMDTTNNESEDDNAIEENDEKPEEGEGMDSD